MALATEYVGVDGARVMRKYGITTRSHGLLFARQRGRCAICRKRAPLVIDHDHKTGKVRGLLCAHCNSGLGFFRDDTVALHAAIGYIFEPPAEYLERLTAE